MIKRYWKQLQIIHLGTFINNTRIIPEKLEEFFINWKSRIQQISISFIFDVSSNLEIPDEIMKVIEKYQKIGTIKNFERLD